MAAMRPGDWLCPSCGEHKFAKKTECQCGGKRPQGMAPAPAAAMKSGDWLCPQCGDHQFARNAQCRKCSSARPAPAEDKMVVDAPAPAATVREEYYLALDIETRGSWYTNPVVAAGVFLAPKVPRPDGHGVIKKRWALRPLPGQVDEARCNEEFWAKFPVVDQWIRANEQDARVVMTELRAFCRLHATDKQITILTDCPDFDLGRLDHLGYATGTWDMPIRYLDVNQRHNQRDPGERVSQAGPTAKAGFDAWLQKHAPHAKHTHFPDDDAEHEYWQMIYCDELRGK